MSNPLPPNPDAPDFTPDEWNYALDLRGSNCYQYAFAGSRSDGSNVFYDEIPAEPGQLVGHAGLRPERDPTSLLNALQLDGIAVVGKSLPPSKPGYYLVGVYVFPDEDVHFVRQDRDGGWSDKPGVGREVKRYIEPSPDGTIKPLPEKFGLTGYHLIGYAYAPQEGINLGLEKPIAADLKVDPTGKSLRPLLDELTLEYLKKLGETLAKYNPQDVVDHYNQVAATYLKPLANEKDQNLPSR